MLILTTFIFFLRVAIRFRGNRTVATPDYILLAAYVVFVGMASMYLATIPALYRWLAATLKQTDMYPSYIDDLVVMRKIMLIGAYLLWITLWAVKLTFLALYWKLVNQLPRYKKMWWVVIIFVVLVSLLHRSH